jgi:hypothetical protein
MYRTKMNFMRNAIGIASLVALAAFSPAASAETVIPPGNSAATQYTEAFPTSGGEADVNKEINSSHLEPSKVLGKHKTRALESQGNDGREVAIITAVTGPGTVEPEQPAEGAGGAHHAKPKPAPAQGNGQPADQSQDSQGNGGQAGPNDPSVTVSQPSGSSGLGEILGQATGTSSGELGLLLPLILIGTVVVSLTYGWRQRRAAH